MGENCERCLWLSCLDFIDSILDIDGVGHQWYKTRETLDPCSRNIYLKMVHSFT